MFINYFLIWKIILNQISRLPFDLRQQYLENLNSSACTSITETLLPRILLLLPNKPHTVNENGDNVDMFNDEIEGWEANYKQTFLDHLVCLTYKQLLISLPAYVRNWHNNKLNKNKRQNIEDYTAQHVSMSIIRSELSLVSGKCGTTDGLTISTRPRARQVLACYQISDAEFEISIELPANFPLEPVKLETLKKAGVAMTKWRYWILQMTSLLHSHNGRILDALLFWQAKVDRSFDGVEECMICFSVVHGANQSLPKLTCKTCHKKFHGECLYKWFDSSNKSTCPLCRQPMTFN